MGNGTNHREKKKQIIEKKKIKMKTKKKNGKFPVSGSPS